MTEDFKAFVDRELTPEEMDRVSQLLAEDPQAQEEVRQLEALSKAFSSAEALPEPAGLEATLAALNNAPKPKPARGLGLWRKQVWATVSVLVLAVLIVPTLNQTLSREAGGSADMARAASMEGAETKSASAPAESDGAAPASAAPARGGFANEMDKSKSFAPEDSVVGSGVPDLTVPPMVIRTGSLGVKVEDAAEGQKKTVDLAREMGGFVQDSNLNRDAATKQDYATVTIRVPERRFEAAMNRIATYGEVLERSVSGQDVGAQVVDLEARIKTLRAEEEQYLTLLKATKKIGDILIVKDRLSQVRMQIESMDASRKHLRNAAALSTITVNFSEPEQVREASKNPSSWDESWSAAFNRLNGIGTFLGNLAINVFVMAPLWLPIVFLGWWISRRKN